MITCFRGRNYFLSNFYYCQIHFDGDEYISVEHAFQASKTLNKEERKFIRQAETSTKAKYFGQKVTLRSDWENIKNDIMYQLLKQKFSVRWLCVKLLETYPEKIIEENTWGDRYWGAELVDGKYVGKNILGKLLMRIRKEINNGE